MKTSKKKNSKSLKFLFYFIFAIHLFLILDFANIYNFILFSINDSIIYVQPSNVAIILSYCIMIANIIVLFLLYDRIIIKKAKNNSSKKIKILIFSFIVITIIAGCISLSSYSYIDRYAPAYESKSLFKDENIFKKDNVKEINIFVEDIASSPTGSIIYNGYIIECEFICSNYEYTLESDFFKDYSNMYNYLCNFENIDININKEKLSNLYEYESNKPLASAKKIKDNINNIEKIFSL